MTDKTAEAARQRSAGRPARDLASSCFLICCYRHKQCNTAANIRLQCKLQTAKRTTALWNQFKASVTAVVKST